MSTYFDLTEHRKTIASREIRLSADLTVIPMDPSNEDDFQNRVRTLEANRLGTKVNERLEEAQEHFDHGRDTEAKAALKEAGKLDEKGRTLLLEILRTRVCDPDGKKLTVAALNTAVGDQNEVATLINVAAVARTVDPQTQPQASSSSS